MAAELATWEVARRRVARRRGPLVEIPTVYDGEDLPWVAEQWGVDVEGAVAEHSGTELRAAFCGFAPGFAYLVGLPAAVAPAPPGHPAAAGPGRRGGRRRRVHRASTRRRRPGGWHLIGRTDAVLWDPDRPRPALIAPGDRVRFVPVGP